MEIEYCGQAMKDGNIFAESVYIGGGTPTTLTAEQLDLLLKKIEKCFDLSKTAEFTVEAGRPDTITKEKLDVLSAHKIQRISINPQTMKDETLKIIGRDHDSQQIRDAFKMAVAGYDFLVNADVIAGLPGEKPEDFERTLSELIELGPANITVHTLAVKKASRLIEADETYHYRQADVVEEMLAISKDMLRKSGYRPYYLYRQKHMAGALENIGYCKDDTPCVYNIRIMDESQSILALGAGGISKKYYPHENRLERVPNVSNYQIYIERIDEMIDRKRKNFFEEDRKCLSARQREQKIFCPIKCTNGTTWRTNFQTYVKDMGLKEIRTPMFEHTEVFARGIGDTTDVVQKEMYTFNDHAGRSITLKPEGTSGAVRAFIDA